MFRRAMVLVMVLLAATGVSARQTRAGGTGTIEGQVLDAQRGVLPGVTITATSGADTAGAQSTVSDGEGRFALSVPSGRIYTVTADLSGFSPFTRPEVQVDTGQTVALDIQLDVGGLSETVTVLGEETTRSRNTIERVQDVPLSISIVPGAELERTEATGMAAITQRVANVSWNFGNQRTSSLSIRGVGKQGQTEAQDPSVGVIVDGVNYAYNALTSAYDFTDVESVEVTRGPQGTLQGKNTSLGVINVITKRPGFTPTADASVTLGQLGTVLTRVAAGGPINGRIAWRGTFSSSKGNGDMHNDYNRDVTYTNLDRVSGRVQMLAVPTPNFSARFQADIQPRGSETTNGRTINLPTPRTYANGTATNLTTDPSTRLARRWFTQNANYSYAGNYLYGGPDGQSVNNDAARGLVTGSRGVSTELNWTFGGYTMTSVSAVKTYHFNAVNDEGTPFDVQRNNGGFFNDYRQASEEIRVSSARGGLVDYQFGVFYIDVENDVDYQKIWGADAGAWYANPTQYSRLDADPAGRFLLQQSLTGLRMSWNSPTGTQFIHNTSAAPFAQANWRLTPSFTLTTGARLSIENRRNNGSTFIRDNGFAPELNPVAVNGVSLGGFDSTSTGALAAASNSLEQLSLADRTANKYFGAAITATPGEAYAALSAAQRQQVADAKAIRAAQIGIVFTPRDAEAFTASQPSFVISPLYKLNESINTYVSWQYGEKAGIAQFVNGLSSLARSEKSEAYEWGVKSVLFGRKLLFNADVFLTDIKDYQQAVRILDVYTTTLNNDGNNYFTTATGNVPRVRVKGVEVDGVFAGARSVSIRFGGAYTDARYQHFPNSAQPVENGYAGAPAYRDVSGQPLPGAARFSFNLAPDLRIPLSADTNLHGGVNISFISRYNADNSLSAYGWIPAHAITDLSLGFGKQRFEVNLIVKNLFDDRTHQTNTWNSYTPAVPRWIGIQFSGKL